MMVRQKSNDFASSSERVTRSQGPVVDLTEDSPTPLKSKSQPISETLAPKNRGRKRKSNLGNDDNEEGLEKVGSNPKPAKPKVKGKGKGVAELGPAKGPATKKQKKPVPEVGVEEKRLARWRAQPTQQLRDRIHRCLTQRMVVLDRKRDMEISPPEETFQIADGIKVMMKVLKARDELVYQSALLSSELEKIFAQAPAAPASQPSSSKSSNRKPLEEDDCPICYSEFDNEESTVYCKAQCGTNIHEYTVPKAYICFQACFKQWAATKGVGKVTCVMCRQPWQGDGDPYSALAKGGVGREGYVNVADQLGMSHYRDTSTYNSGYGGYRKRRYW